MVLGFVVSAIVTTGTIVVGMGVAVVGISGGGRCRFIFCVLVDCLKFDFFHCDKFIKCVGLIFIEFNDCFD